MAGEAMIIKKKKKEEQAEEYKYRKDFKLFNNTGFALGDG